MAFSGVTSVKFTAAPGGWGGGAERESRSGGDVLEVIAHSNGAERATCVSLSPLSPLKSRPFFSN